MKKVLLILPVILLVAAGCNSSNSTSQPTSNQTQTSQQTQTNLSAVTSDQTANWKMYTSNIYHFQIKYPINWIFNETTDHQYFSITPKDSSGTIITISPVNVGRESVFGSGSNVKIQTNPFAGKPAKIYSCPGDNSCPTQLAYSKAINLTSYPTGWGQWNEIDYNITKGDESYLNDFEQILQSIKFTQ